MPPTIVTPINFLGHLLKCHSIFWKKEQYKGAGPQQNCNDCLQLWYLSSVSWTLSLSTKFPSLSSCGPFPLLTKRAVDMEMPPLCSCSVTKSCLTFCDPMDCSLPGFPVLHYFPEFAQTHVYWADDAIQLSYSLLPPSPPALNLSQSPQVMMCFT